jgi:outer membrane protein OmpA-like peptidoglycan-associated protein
MHVELRNVNSQLTTDIAVDTTTGEYVAAVPFRDDYVLTVKRKGFVQETKYISHIDPRFEAVVDMIVNLKPIEVGMTYNLNDIYFDFNSADLRPESKIVIAEFYEFLEENPTIKVSIEGHTDNVGSEVDNLKLSQSRAKSVYNELLTLGISPGRISSKGFGESRPVESNNTEAGRSRNRRTEFVIVEK